MKVIKIDEMTLGCMSPRLRSNYFGTADSI